MIDAHRCQNDEQRPTPTIPDEEHPYRSNNENISKTRLKMYSEIALIIPFYSYFIPSRNTIDEGRRPTQATLFLLYSMFILYCFRIRFLECFCQCFIRCEFHAVVE